ncbi:hypothetical protein PVAND_012182 [Polypedilum vanderplanki]|uniref:Zinc finger protein n=1 Tax=Polypedilum vanderplanki TaxID=319348 RepID=A0A9J6CLM9_POLVA|nr:hypothetical protein PVAND_012182 [Polypedilum vanderplanki]
MNEVADLSELCRLCLDSSSSLISFETVVHFSTKSIPELIKYCVDVESNLNDGGISPKNICQPCLEKLQVIHEFKWKCHESDKYIKQIISHSGEIVTDEADITPYNPAPLDESYSYDDGGDDDDDEDNLLQPMEPMNFNYQAPPTLQPKLKSLKSYPKSDRLVLDGIELKKGMRHGMFVCQLCNKSFKYVKPYKNHLKTHKGNSKPLSYYKRRKQLLSSLTGAPVRSAQVTAKLSVSLPKPKQIKPEPQAEYDSISPYNSPGPFEQDSVALHSNARDSSPDFGEFMLHTSRQLLNGDEGDDAEDLLVEKAVGSGRPVRNARKSMNNDDDDYNPNGRSKPKPKPIMRRSMPAAVAPEKRRVRSTIEEIHDSPPRKPGPASKTRGRQRRREDEEEGFSIEGFSEVDITKMLKRKEDNDNGVYDEDTTSQQSQSNRSRSRSSSVASVELIPEVDIFGR